MEPIQINFSSIIVPIEGIDGARQSLFKAVSDHIVQQLRRCTSKRHRSLQGELLAILEENVQDRQILTPTELLAAVRGSGLRTPEESSKFIRGELVTLDRKLIKAASQQY